MKNITEYSKPLTIYLIPNHRNGNSLRVDFDLKHPQRKLNPILLRDTLRKLDFPCTDFVGSFNTTEESNILDIALDLCVDERRIIEDLIHYIEERFLGKDSVLDRTRSTIKKENKQMNK